MTLTPSLSESEGSVFEAVSADCVSSARAAAAALSTLLSEREQQLSASVDSLFQTGLRADRTLSEISIVLGDLAAAGGYTVPDVLRAQEVVVDAQHPAVIEAEQILADQRVKLGRTRRAAPEVGRTERRITFVAFTALFIAIGYISARVGGMIPGDALSRVGSGQSVFFSRDPHLEALGFIWGPFPTMFQLPFIALRAFWLPFTSSGMAAIVVSALFMAGTLSQLLAWGVETGTKQWFRIVAVLLVAAQPLIWTHGGNGMSEACWLFFLVLATRHLARWIETDDTRSLVVVGSAIAAGYLTRYETAAVFAAVLPVVGLVTWNRSASQGVTPRSAMNRRWDTVVDLTILAFPVVVTMVAWAAASWAIIGEPFPQFTSAYGNSALVARSAESNIELIGDAASAGRAWFFIRQMLVASPLLVVLAVMALWGTRRTCLRATVALAVLGSPLALQLLFAARGSTFPWLRYTVIAVVLAAALAMVIASEPPKRSVWVTGFALFALVPGIFWTLNVVQTDQYASFDQTEAIEALSLGINGDSVDPMRSMTIMGQQVAEDIDARVDVEPGTVLMDQAGIGVLPAAPRPNVYVVPSDRDFGPAVAAPEDFGVRYLLLLESSGADQLVSQFPDLWEGGGTGFAKQVAEWGDESAPKTHYRLFEVNDPDPTNRAQPDPEFGR